MSPARSHDAPGELLGPDNPPGMGDYERSKMLETLIFIQREALKNGDSTREALVELRLLRKDMDHLVSTFGARVESVERSVHGIDARQTAFETRGDLKLTSLAKETETELAAIKERLNKLDLMEAGRAGMIRGGWFVWSAVIAVVGALGALVGWVLAHLPPR